MNNYNRNNEIVLNYIDIDNMTYEDLQNLGFHFTDGIAKISSVSREGLKAKIGDNSDGFEATPKISFSLGANGAMQTANRFLNLAQQLNINVLLTPTHGKYLSDKVKRECQNSTNIRPMNVFEAFEFIYKYLSESAYFSFECKKTEFEHEPKQEDIIKANEEIPNVTGSLYKNNFGESLIVTEDGKAHFSKLDEKEEKEYKLFDQFNLINQIIKKYMNKGRTELSNKEREIFELFTNAKNSYTMQIMEATEPLLNRGIVYSEGLYDKVRFAEDKLFWKEQQPVNMQTCMRIGGTKITKIGSEYKLSRVNVSGKEVNAIEVLKSLANKVPEDEMAIKSDFNMIPTFLEYVEFKENNPTIDISEYVINNPESNLSKHIKIIQDYFGYNLKKEQEIDTEER